MKREADKRVRGVFSDQMFSAPSAQLQANSGEVEWLVVEHAADAMVAHVVDEASSGLEGLESKVIHVGSIARFIGRHRCADAVDARPIGKFSVVAVPDTVALLLYFSVAFELADEHPGEQVGHHP